MVNLLTGGPSDRLEVPDGPGRCAKRGLASALLSVAAGAALLGSGAPAHSAAALQGVYAAEGTLLDRGSLPPGAPPPTPRRTPEMKPKGQYAADYAALQAAVARGEPYEEPSYRCLPQGMPRFWTGPYAFEIVQTPTQINIYQEWNQQTRRIYLDGRNHPADADPTYNGHSIGHWEGDVLAIDTVGVSTDALLTTQGLKHSEKLHITEQLKRVSPTRLEVTMTVEDPEALAEPWTRTVYLNQKSGFEIGEYICAQNNREAALVKDK